MEMREYYDGKISIEEVVRNPHGPDTSIEMIMNEEEQRRMILWLWNHRRVLCGEIICEECPEAC